jgi:hypothetical protein
VKKENRKSSPMAMDYCDYGFLKVGIVNRAVIWPLVIGPHSAKEFLMRGNFINGAEAARIGMLNYAVPHEQVSNKARALPQELSDGPTGAIRWSNLASFMRGLKFLTAIVIVCAWAGCATAPRSWQVTHDPLLARQGGVLLLVDASVQEDTLVGHDYFVINEAGAGAAAASAALRKYVQASDIPVRAEVITVGGARLTTNNAPIGVADSVGGQVRQAQQPLRVPGAIQDDTQYVSALCAVSTYAFERAAVHSNAPTSISTRDFLTAAEVIKNRTQASSVLFLGVLGWSRSTGKRAAQFVVGLAVGEVIAFATAGLGRGYYLIFIPGHAADGMVMEAALIDLESGQLTWSNAVRSIGDPVHPEAMADPQALDLLFHDIIFKPMSDELTPSSKP